MKSPYFIKYSERILSLLCNNKKCGTHTHIRSYKKMFSTLNNVVSNEEENKNIQDAHATDSNNEIIIEKYKNLIRNTKLIKDIKEKKNNFQPNGQINQTNSFPSPKKKEKIKSKTIINDIININDTNLDSSKNNLNKSQNDSCNNLMSSKDEKYVILKKQITKEFIHQVFLPHVESQIIYHLKTYTPDQIVNIFQVYSYLYYYDKKKEMIDQLLEYLEYRLDCFSVHNVLLILEPLYILNQTNNIYIYRLIINYLYKIEDKLNIYNYIGISRVFTKILIDLYFKEQEEQQKGHNLLSIKFILKYFKEQKFKKKITPNERSIPHIEYITNFMLQVIDKIEKQLDLLSAIELTDLLSVMSNYSYKNNYSKYYIPLEYKNNTTMQQNNELSLDISNECIHVIHQNNKKLYIYNLSTDNSYLFKENIIAFLIVNRIIQKYTELTTLHKITNMHNLIKLSIYDDQYIKLIENDINNYHYINNIHHKYLSLLIWCLFKYNILYKYINKLKPILQQNIYNFNAKGFARLSHAIYEHKDILYQIANNLIKNINQMNINEFLCFFYSLVLHDLLPYQILNQKNNTDMMNSVHVNHNIKDIHTTGNDNIINILNKNISNLNKRDILHKCLQYIDKNKRDMNKEQMVKIVQLLKKKKQQRYLYILDMLPDEWKGMLHLIN
ncbi:conserved Plasmodium protein, unknown function [Plasmodium sp. DRC-Itaito]|nr:conserved Plasmodium protein, unknown function [Plasmodium sp. DRC-Itaito]